MALVGAERARGLIQKQERGLSRKRDGQVEAFGPRAEILNRLMAPAEASGPRAAVSPAA